MSRGRAFENVGRAPVPEWEEFARAAWPGRVPVGLSAWSGRWNLTFFLLGLAVQLIAAWLRMPWLGLAAWLVPALCDWLSTRSDPSTSRLLDLVGLRPPMRALLRSTVAAAAIFAAEQPNNIQAGLTYVCVVLFVQLAWQAQPALAIWVSRVAPALRFLPRSAVQPSATSRYLRIYARAAGTPVVLTLIEAAALVDATLAESQPVGSLTGLLGLTVAIALLETALLYLGWAAWQAHTARRDVRATGGALIEELTALQPRFIVYISLGARQAKYIANQWIPAIDALPQQGMLMVREASQLGELAPSRHPVVYAPTPRDVERLTLPSVRAAFYLAYGERNGQLQRDPRLRHILLMHGDSDKATSANNMARAADELWVAGPAAAERFVAAGIDLPPATFVTIGRPQVAALPVGPTGNERPIVLYAPTFEGYYDQTSYTSLDRMGVRLVKRLLRKHPEVRVWFRPHPASGLSRTSMLAAITEINTVLRHAGDGHLVTADEGLSLNDCLARADVLISDISSVATDFLYTTRPILTCNPSGLAPEEFVSAFPSQASSYLIAPDLEGLAEGLEQALGADRLRDARLAMKKHVLGDTPLGPQAAFEANVARVTAEPDGPRER